MKIADWLGQTTADAERRGLSELVPMLQTLARSTEALRAADAEFAQPMAADHTEHTEKGSGDDGRG